MISVGERIKAILDRECKAHIQDGYKGCPRTYVGMDCVKSHVNCYLCHKHDALAREIAEIQEGK